MNFWKRRVTKIEDKNREQDLKIQEIIERFQTPDPNSSSRHDAHKYEPYLDHLLAQSVSALDSGISYLASGKCDIALTHLNYALNPASNDSVRTQVHFFRGATYDCLGELSQAIKEFDAVIAIDSLDINAWNWKAILLSDSGLYPEALATYDRALRINSRNAYVLNNKSTTYFEAGKTDSALVLCDSSLSIQPGDADALSNRCAYLNELGRNEEAMIDCRAAIKISPYHSHYLYNMGLVFAASGQYDSARYYFEGAIWNQLDFIDAYASLANCFAEEGRLDEAIPLYEYTLSKRRNDAITHYNFGRALFFSKKCDEALSHYDSALGIKPDYPEALAGKGACLAVSEKQIAAGRAFLDAAKLFASDARMSEAILTIRAALQVDPMLKEEILNSPELFTLHSDPEFRKLVGLG